MGTWATVEDVEARWVRTDENKVGRYEGRTSRSVRGPPPGPHTGQGLCDHVASGPLDGRNLVPRLSSCIAASPMCGKVFEWCPGWTTSVDLSHLVHLWSGPGQRKRVAEEPEHVIGPSFAQGDQGDAVNSRVDNIP